jgi:transketolase
VFDPDPGKGMATRAASGEVLSALAPVLPELWGGSADLAGSNNTTMKGVDSFGPPSISTKDYTAHWYGRTLHFGVREHAMAAIVNGLSLSKLRAFGATFFIFSDYARPAIRLSAMMELPTIFVFTHDAMGDGEDGPTHQPVEQLASFRAEPGLVVLRPGDANEVVEAYRYIMQLRHQPAVLALSRQPLCVKAHEELRAEGIRSRVVSMPSWDIFEHQTQAYQDSVLPPEVTARVAVEQASTFGWERYVGRSGRVIGMKTFGASAPLKELQRKFGFEPERVTDIARELIGKRTKT